MLKMIIILFVVSLVLQLINVNYANALAKRCSNSIYGQLGIIKAEAGYLGFKDFIISMIPVLNILVAIIHLVYLVIMDIKLASRGI